MCTNQNDSFSVSVHMLTPFAVFCSRSQNFFLLGFYLFTFDWYVMPFTVSVCGLVSWGFFGNIFSYQKDSFRQLSFQQIEQKRSFLLNSQITSKICFRGSDFLIRLNRILNQCTGLLSKWTFSPSYNYLQKKVIN